MLAHFEFEGSEYSIPNEPADVVRLPDGRLFLVGYWIETHPSQPGGLTAIGQDKVGDRKVVDATIVAG